MRILHVIAGAKPGGAESFMLDAVFALDDAGVDQHVVTRDGAASRIAALKEAGVALSLANFDKVWRDPTKAVIRQTAQKFSPDVIHYWMARAAAFAPKSWRARNLAWHGAAHKIERFKNCDWHAPATRKIALRLIGEGVCADRVSVLHAFAEFPPAAPADRASLATPESAQVVLAISRTSRRHWCGALIEALGKLPGVYLWFAGEGQEKDDVLARAEKGGVSDRVRCLGEHPDRGALLAACDIVAFSARDEPFGAVAVEAWAAGKPVVAAAGKGANFVEHEVDALVAPEDDAGALREALRRVLEDAELARRLAENGMRAYQANHTKTAFVRASMALYERVRLSALERRKPAA